MIIVTNEELTAVIDVKGAELKSLSCNGIEYMWQADPKFWAKHAPVLFPIVGELKDGKYFFNGREYKLPRHGFARDKKFDAEQTSEASAIFSLTSDAESLVVYPFEFILRVEFEVRDRKLLCTYHVENTNDKTMYFSVGGHPAFNVPVKKDLSYTDYFLEFDEDEVLTRHLLRDGLLSGDTEPLQLDNRILHLYPGLFYKDAIVLKHLDSRQISLSTDKDSRGLRFNFDGFPYFGIWASKDAPFVCLEPWCGIADSIHHNNDLATKEGINQLQSGESWERTWSVEVF